MSDHAALQAAVIEAADQANLGVNDAGFANGVPAKNADRLIDNLAAAGWSITLPVIEATYADWVGRVASALHEDCKLEWQAIAVADPSRLVTMHEADAHLALAHSLVRRLALAPDPGWWAEPQRAT